MPSKLIYLSKKYSRYLNFFIIFIVSFIILFLRRTDAFLNPQFWAEDGTIFYAQAYNLGIAKSLVLPYSGYLHMLPRLVAGLSQFVSLNSAPLLFNSVAIFCQIIPVLIFCSKRFESVIYSYQLRLFISGIYLCLPNCVEIHSNLTNSHWFLILSCLLVLFSPLDNTKHWSIFDALIFLITGLSTVTSTVILLFAFGKYLIYRTKKLKTYLLVLIFTSAVQIYCLSSSGTRTSYNLLKSIDFDSLSKMTSYNLFSPTLIGLKGTRYLLKVLQNTFNESLLNVSIYIFFFLSVAWLVYCLVKSSSYQLKLLIIFSALVISISLIASLTNSLELLISVGSNNRYYFYATITCMLTWVWGAFAQRVSWVKYLSFSALVITLFVGVTGDFVHPAYTDFSFSYHAEKFVELQSGEKYDVPINPNWQMHLVKH